jgi:uncharacterized membrane protein (UPF0127 family)
MMFQGRLVRRVFLLLLPLWLAACEPSGDAEGAVVFLGPQPMLPTQTLVLEGGGSPSPLTLTVEIADEDAERAQGLMFRPRLADGHGMLFVWPTPQRNVFWMKHTPEPLDLLFFRNGKLVGTITYAKPFDETPLDPGVDSDWVLEVPAGFAAVHQLLPNLAWQGRLMPHNE